MLIISWPWAFFKLWLLIILAMSILEKSQKVNMFFVTSVSPGCNTLLLGTREHCSAKKN